MENVKAGYETEKEKDSGDSSASKQSSPHCSVPFVGAGLMGMLGAAMGQRAAYEQQVKDLLPDVPHLERLERENRLLVQGRCLVECVLREIPESAARNKLLQDIAAAVLGLRALVPFE